jgi:hypothetical protein
MKYFTPELIERLGSSDDAIADAAQAEWEDAVDRHEAQLQAIRPHLPPALAHLWDNYHLHDADVLAMGRQGCSLLIVLRLDVPPRDLLVLNYELAEDPKIDPDHLPAEARCPLPQWLYDEIGWVPGSPGYATHTVLFSNGWQIELHLRDLQVMPVQPLLPDSSAPVVTPVPQSA